MREALAQTKIINIAFAAGQNAYLAQVIAQNRYHITRPHFDFIASEYDQEM